MPFNIGDRVQALWDDGRWLHAKIIGHAPTFQTYTVRWDEDGSETSGFATQDGRLRLPVQSTPASQLGNEPGAGESHLETPPQQAA